MLGFLRHPSDEGNQASHKPWPAAEGQPLGDGQGAGQSRREVALALSEGRRRLGLERRWEAAARAKARVPSA